MRRVPESEIADEFERSICWGDDERHLYYPDRRKAAVFGHFLRIEEVLRLVDLHSPGKRVADLACAQGNFALLLAEKGYDVTAVDLHPTFLRYAQKKYETGKCRFIQSNIMEFRDPDGFDCILLGEVIEHVAHPERLLLQAVKNLKPGGVLILTTPNGAEFSSGLPTFKEVTDLEALIPRQFHYGDHLFLYTVEELHELFSRVGLTPLYTEKYHSAYVSQIKGIRYLMPLRLLQWMERKTRHWKIKNKDSAGLLILAAKKLSS